MSTRREGMRLYRSNPAPSKVGWGGLVGGPCVSSLFVIRDALQTALQNLSSPAPSEFSLGTSAKHAAN